MVHGGIISHAIGEDRHNIVIVGKEDDGGRHSVFTHSLIGRETVNHCLIVFVCTKEVGH